MKGFIISMVILAVMISGGIASDVFLSNVYDNVNSFSEQIKSAALEENYEQMQQIYDEMYDYWERKEELLTVIIDHAYISNIDISMSEIEAGIEKKESIEVLLASSRVKTTVEVISLNEHFNIKNIL